MILVLAKVLISPLLLASSTFVAQRWGGLLGGLLLGLPLVSGPVSVMLFAQYGSRFAVNAAGGTLLGFVAAAAFCAAYALVSLRRPWWQSLIAAYVAFFVTAALLSVINLTLSWALVVGPLVLAVSALSIEVPTGTQTIAAPGKGAVVVRMLIAGAMVLLLTTSARFLGAEISGFLAPLPVLAAIMAVTSHRDSGSAAVHTVLRGAVLGSWGGVAFFSMIILLGRSVDPLTMYVLAAVAAVVAGACAVALQSAADAAGLSARLRHPARVPAWVRGHAA